MSEAPFLADLRQEFQSAINRQKVAVPKRRYLSKPAIAGGLILVAVIIVASALWVLKPQPITSTAFADWSPISDSINAETTKLIHQLCTTRLAPWHDPLGEMVVIDKRGNVTMAMYVGESDDMRNVTSCVVRDRGQGFALEGSTSVGGSHPLDYSDRPLTVFGFGNVGDLEYGRIGHVRGKVSDEVESVEVSIPDIKVQAKVQNGYFVAWWVDRPVFDFDVVAYDKAGVEIDRWTNRLPVPPPQPAPSPTWRP